MAGVTPAVSVFSTPQQDSIVIAQQNKLVIAQKTLWTIILYE